MMPGARRPPSSLAPCEVEKTQHIRSWSHQPLGQRAVIQSIDPVVFPLFGPGPGIRILLPFLSPPNHIPGSTSWRPPSVSVRRAVDT